MKNWKDDSSVGAMRQALSQGGTDLVKLHQPTLNKYAGQPTDMQTRPSMADRDSTNSTSALLRLRGTIAEVDESAATLAFTISPRSAGGTANLAASVMNFRGFDLTWPSGALAGRITSAIVEDGELVCVADLFNSQVVSDLASGAFNGVEALCQQASNRSMIGAPGSVRPLTVRLVATQSGLNPIYQKRFAVRRADGRVVKRDFSAKPSMGTGRGANLDTQLTAFKKIHRTGGAPLGGDELMKMSQPRTGEKAVNQMMNKARNSPTAQGIKKAHRSGKRVVP